MKKSYLLLFVVTLLTSNIFAQEDTWPVKGDGEIGVILGFNLSQYYGSDIESDEVDYNTGIIFGASYDQYFSDTWRDLV